MLLPVLLGLVLLSALVVRLMIRVGVMDVPGARSSHAAPTPKGGGIGIAAAFLAGLAVFWALGALHEPGRQGAIHAAALLAAGALVTGFSWADDVGQFGFRAKLGAQIVASGLLIAAGYTIHRIGPVPLGWAAIPFTLAWMLGTINAVNFIDGLNGLASGSVLIVAIAAAFAVPDPAMQIAMLALAAGIVGFLPFNYPRARIFMGDAGSQLCGLLVAAAAACAAGGPGAWDVIIVPLGLAAILADVAFTLVRRLRAGDRLTEAHRGHLYQLANRSGLDAALVTLIYWGLALWGGILGLMAGDAGLSSVAAAVLLTIAPFAVWAFLVVRMARRAPIGRW